jgi:hypothetical protein
MTIFHIGQKVTPIGRQLSESETLNFNAALKHGVVFPKKGEVYTVREATVVTRSTGEEVLVLRLCEIHNKRMKFTNGKIGEIGFNADCFRPVVERKSDISIFKAMLNPSRVEEHA